MGNDVLMSLVPATFGAAVAYVAAPEPTFSGVMVGFMLGSGIYLALSIADRALN